eukprot:CAMPEP_0114625002 /NCGR_PEP_ID=MMETSP0168-20121206/11051_1 /TAXON_ID=95228 ORGANISM="Vannella sp., Strain DIVA3 517/6/12" /NCGR_SAMPLE_ID=MMETSP0168 /ASSEMBLY_ACC=CAM_ASM_000044 /LENGTH=76 /DNA_ID=CAMNT_0001836281 /DNA_START=533 /DNA_END=760 /DNA_ORIENTATION=+
MGECELVGDGLPVLEGLGERLGDGEGVVEILALLDTEKDTHNETVPLTVGEGVDDGVTVVEVVAAGSGEAKNLCLS